MAVSQIEEKILGRLARQTAIENPLLSASLYQVLGLSILLSRKLYRARKLRRLDATRDTKSLQLYHHIIWLAREGLQIAEVYVLPLCQDGQHGPECRVMAAKLRASLYHVFCLFHNHPAIQLLPKSDGSSPESNGRSPKDRDSEQRASSKSPKSGRESSRRRRRASRNALRDAIPSMTSETSYVTNPYSARPTRSINDLSGELRRTPARPPGLEVSDISPTRAAAAFLLPLMDFVPMASAYFETAQHLSNSLLGAANALRLSISLERAAFLWDCEKAHDKARKLARQAIRDVYASPDPLDDDEFHDASALVQALGGIVRRGSNESTPRLAAISPRSKPPSRPAPAPPVPSSNGKIVASPLIDRSIAVSPLSQRRRGGLASPAHARSFTRTPERLSTVPEDPSQEASEAAPTTLSPPISRLSSRSKQRRNSSSTSVGSDKAAKRRAMEEAEEIYRRRTSGAAKNQQQPTTGSPSRSRSHSRQNTPQDGASRRSPMTTTMPPGGSSPSSSSLPKIAPHLRHQLLSAGLSASPRSPENVHGSTLDKRRRRSSHERREAVLTALQIISKEISKGADGRVHDVGVVL